MSLEIPNITEEDDPHAAIRAALEEGGSFIKGLLDVDRFEQAIEDRGLKPLGLSPPNYFEAEAVQAALNDTPLLDELDKEMAAGGLPRFNCISCVPFELGSSLPPHADNTFRSIGLTALIPRSHLGVVSLHGDGHFEVVTTKDSQGSFRRYTSRREEDAEGEFIERQGVYGRGDILLLRQDVPLIGLAAKVHSASSMSKPGDNMSHREVITLDHFVE